MLIMNHEQRKSNANPVFVGCNTGKITVVVTKNRVIEYKTNNLTCANKLGLLEDVRYICAVIE